MPPWGTTSMALLDEAAIESESKSASESEASCRVISRRWGFLLVSTSLDTVGIQLPAAALAAALLSLMAASSSTGMDLVSEVVTTEACLLMIGSGLKPCIKNAAAGSIPDCMRNVTMIIVPPGTPPLPKLTAIATNAHGNRVSGPTNGEIKAFAQHPIGAGLIMAQENIGAHRSKKSGGVGGGTQTEMSLGERAIIARSAFISSFNPTIRGGLKLNTASSNLGGVGVLGAQPYIFAKPSSLTPNGLDFGGRMDVKTSGAEHVAGFGGWEGAVVEAKRQHHEFLAREAVQAVLNAPSDAEAAAAAKEAQRVYDKARRDGLKSQAEEAAEKALNKALKECPQEVAALGFTPDNLRDYMALCDLKGSSPKATWPGHAAIDARDCAVSKAWSKHQLQAYKEHPYLLHHLKIELDNVDPGHADEYSLVNCPGGERLPAQRAAARARALACACKHPQMGEVTV